jgi:AraC family transcriptional regulator
MTAQEAYAALNTYLNKHHLMAHSVSCIGITPDDPDVVPDEDCRFDACIELASEIDYQLEGDVQEQIIEAGRFAVFVHIGPYDTLWKSWGSVYRDWVPSGNEALHDAPPYEVYIDDAATTAPDKLRTEIHVPIE